MAVTLCRGCRKGGIAALRGIGGALLAGCALALPASGRPRPGSTPELRQAGFAADPRWESHRSRLLRKGDPRTVRQAFGYSRTRHAGGRGVGEIGGFVQRSVTPAWYAARIDERTLDHRLRASGTFSVTRAEGGSGLLFGWFHASSRGWRTSNSLVFRLDGNGGSYRVFYEYGTRGWLTGGGGCFEGDAYQTTPTPPLPADGAAHGWSLAYDPDGADGCGTVTFTLDDTPYTLPVPPEHRRDGAVFNRFGILCQQAAGDGLEAFFDDVEVDGRLHTFDRDPRWDARANRGEEVDRFVRPLHDFGFSPGTRHAGGRAGEVGGVVWRDERPAYYADRVGPLSLEHGLYAEGRIAMARAASDSAVYIGWFGAGSRRQGGVPPQSAVQRDIVGLLVEGPSRAGHYVRAAYRTSSGEGAVEPAGPVIKPDGRPHTWSIRYTPGRGGGKGRIAVRLDGHEQVTEVSAEHQREGAVLDRFGILHYPRGGLFLEVYLDDLKYTAASPQRTSPP